MGKHTEESRLAQIDNAKKYLESQGFFTANLWHTDDVCQNYDDVNQDERTNSLYSFCQNRRSFCKTF